MASRLQATLESVHHAVAEAFGRGRVADYIPALARVPADAFGMAVVTVDGEQACVGDAETAFSIQSISKVFTLARVMEVAGDSLWQRVGREPSGTRFNSLVQLEYENGIPRNPFINAGALVVTDRLLDAAPDAAGEILARLRRLAGSDAPAFDHEVVASESEHGDLNRALGHFLRACGNLNHDVSRVLDAYFHHCAIRMTCLELARAGVFLANRGQDLSGARVVSARQAKQLNSLMLTCGLYDSVGDFAYRVGLPAKSGVGGGILAVVPGEMSLCVWSPELDRSGNSLVGTRALEAFTSLTGCSIF
ncbi:MAG: glutaminase [Gammaproteobacteria bacterium]